MGRLTRGGVPLARVPKANYDYIKRVLRRVFPNRVHRLRNPLEFSQDAIVTLGLG